MSFGNVLKKLRVERKLTQAKLASLLSLGESTISFYENDKREPDYKTLQKLADFFDVSVDYLLGKTPIRESYLQIIKQKPDISKPSKKIKQPEYINLHEKIDLLSEEKRKLVETITDSFLREDNQIDTDEQSACIE